MTDILYITEDMGLCNKLRGLVAALALCSKAKMNLHVRWITTHECPYAFEDLFEIPNNTKFVTEEEMKSHGEYKVVTKDMGHLCHLLPNQGLSYHLAPLLISMLNPLPQIKDKIKTLVKEYNINNCIGFHIRKTDHVQYANSIGQSTPVEEFMEIIRNTAENIYLACDDKQVQEDFKKKFGERIKVYKSIETNDNFRQTDGEHAVIDIYLLSLCKAFKGSFASSFTQHVLYLQEAWKIRPKEYKQYFL